MTQLINDSVVHLWDLATAIGVDPGLDEQLVENSASSVFRSCDGLSVDVDC